MNCCVTTLTVTWRIGVFTSRPCNIRRAYTSDEPVLGIYSNCTSRMRKTNHTDVCTLVCDRYPTVFDKTRWWDSNENKRTGMSLFIVISVGRFFIFTDTCVKKERVTFGSHSFDRRYGYPVPATDIANAPPLLFW